MEYSQEGDEALDILDRQDRFTGWMYEVLEPYLKGHILEVGSGTGTYSKYLVKKDSKLVLSDVDSDHVALLKKKFKRNDVYKIDISDPKDITRLTKKHRFDSIIFSNVLEHVKEDEKALKLLRTLLKKDGRIICLVPAHKWLYNTLDEALDHHRRYTSEELKQKCIEAGYIVEEQFMFNLFAIPGWFVNGNVFKKSVVNESAVTLFNSLVPLFKFLEKYVFFRKLGVSTVIVARRS